MTRGLAVFDVDGTLTDTSRIDETCFLRAMASTLDLHDVKTDWVSYDNCTDAGIVRQAFTSRFGRLPTDGEIAEFIHEFVRQLDLSYRTEPRNFSPIPGADALIGALRLCDGWSVSIATGCWAESARFKLTRAGIPLDGAAFASCTDSPSRQEVVRISVGRAEAQYGGSFERIVLVGDAVWDVRTARSVKLPFVGIGVGQAAEKLRRSGAVAVLPNFLDISTVIQQLSSALVPVAE
jgi:phosphoglycolate phosphatase-like HAD superfamily hydrolase